MCEPVYSLCPEQGQAPRGQAEVTEQGHQEALETTVERRRKQAPAPLCPRESLRPVQGRPVSKASSPSRPTHPTARPGTPQRHV